MKKNIEEIGKEYDLELNNIIEIIKKEKAKLVLLQFPDGMKPYATVIADFIMKKTGCESVIWLGSCFGACDLPRIEHLRPKIDLIVQFGHSPWNYKGKKIRILR